MIKECATNDTSLPDKNGAFHPHYVITFRCLLLKLRDRHLEWHNAIVRTTRGSA